jgi:hypothetical protein
MGLTRGLAPSEKSELAMIADKALLWQACQVTVIKSGI